MKLKTLKDLKQEDPQPCCGELSEFQIRQEAIRWVVNWEKINKKSHTNEIYAFKVFFNIKEEEL